MDSPEVLGYRLAAISQTDGWFAVITNSGVALGSESGVFKKRVDVKFVPFEQIASWVVTDGGYKDRVETTLAVLGHKDQNLFSLVWTGWLRAGSSDPRPESRRIAAVLEAELRN